MDRFQRILKLHQIFSHRRYPVSSRTLAEQMECSVSSVKRAIEEMRNYVNAPIVYDRKQVGYYYKQAPGSPQFELPGLWFSGNEIFAMLSMEQLLVNLEPGFLEQALSPIRKRLYKIQSNMTNSGRFNTQRLKILGIGQRAQQPVAFQRVAAALFNQRQLEINYHARSNDAQTKRVISPQRLVHYRHNWYLDAWCHKRKALRVFALERITIVNNPDKHAIQMSAIELDSMLSGAYGIFSGPPKQKAVLRFSAERTRWIADELWHPNQVLKMLDNGGCELTIPYADDRELIQDILKHGRHVEAVSPPELRRCVVKHLMQTQAIYQN